MHRKQRTVQVSLSEYLGYLENRECHCLERNSKSGGWKRVCEDSVPFYLNGWAALSAVPQLSVDCPLPYFAEAVDHTEMILEQTWAAIFRASGDEKKDELKRCASETSTRLTKVFMGPPGTITRLHQDAHNAHAWLSQVRGRKLLIMYPPSDGKHLGVIPGEVETVQSGVDPLLSQLKMCEEHPKHTNASPRACILNPGEAVLIPQNWWHYAVALETSVTVMRNFYNADTNISSLVRQVISKLRSNA